MKRISCELHTERPQPRLVEMCILHDQPSNDGMRGYRLFRIEYGSECGCPEGLVWLPPGIDPELIEDILAIGSVS